MAADNTTSTHFRGSHRDAHGRVDSLIFARARRRAIQQEFKIKQLSGYSDWLLGSQQFYFLQKVKKCLNLNRKNMNNLIKSLQLHKE